MTRLKAADGFALLLVLWALFILSAIALGLAATSGTEIREAQDYWNDLQAERLAHSGPEFAKYLDTRQIGTAAEDLSGLPVQPVVPGLTYRVTLDAGTIDLQLEGENGKFDPASVPEDVAAAFFGAWTGDSGRGSEIAAAIADWVDADDDPRPLGAESESYSDKGYLPRNAALGSADLPLIHGFRPQDFGPVIVDTNAGPVARKPLAQFIANVRTGSGINPNYAPPAVLNAIPGMSEAIRSNLVAMRQQTPFTNGKDFTNRLGLADDSILLKYLTFDRGTSPAVLSVARLRNSTRVHSEKRTQTTLAQPLNPQVMIRALATVERDVYPD